ncbi:hypothetical protein GCM10009836_19620 [Pseudonocardia ailaonensis]|uniref:Uncharacterized protein n=1 Tax=Pseudonocardia ailaonensis TaxID=367279 RepID=A0ABN2MWN9_9PSEU
MLRRFLAALLLVPVLLPVLGGRAAAHSGGLEAEADLPRVVALEPAVPGLVAAVVEGGARLSLTNGTAATVEVVPAGVRGEEPAAIAPGESAHWTDPRIRGTDGTVTPWTIPLRVGDRDVAIRGETTWPPPPATAGWWTLTAVLAAGATALGVLAVRRRGAAYAVAGLTVVALAAHAVHVLGSASVPVGLDYWPTVLGTAGIGLVAWVAGPVGVALVPRVRSWGLLSCAIAGAVLALVTALDTGSFARAVLPYAWDPTLDRISTACTVGIGLGLFVTGFAVLRAMTPETTEQELAEWNAPERGTTARNAAARDTTGQDTSEESTR